MMGGKSGARQNKEEDYEPTLQKEGSMLQADGKNCKAERFVVLEQLLRCGGGALVDCHSLSCSIGRMGQGNYPSLKTKAGLGLPGSN